MTAEQHRQLELYRTTLLTWSARVNLIGPEARANLDAHIAEALAAAAILDPEGEVIDVGSGGGLPAIPMAIASPKARFHLVDSDQKKWSFLKFVVRTCSLNSRVYGDRLERVVSNLDSHVRFGLATSRAVGHPESWLPGLAPVLSDKARIALFEGSDADPRILGFDVDSVHRLPRGESNYLVILKKT